MPADHGPRRDPLTELVAYYGDLGVRDLFVAVSPGSVSGEEVEAPAPTLVQSPPPARPSPASERRPPAVAPKAPSGPPGPRVVVATERPTPPPAVQRPAEEVAAELQRIATTVAACRRCKLCETRTQTVFSDGSAGARLMFVGEAPGADEDAQGVPFVGKAGQLLTRMIEGGMGLPRRDVYICNVLKCRPPGNRNPLPEEISECRGYLEAQVQLIRPSVIVALGNFAAKFLLETEEGIMRLRGRWGSYQGIPVMPTFHPSFLLRSPERKRDAWEDLLKVLERLGLPQPQARR